MIDKTCNDGKCSVRLKTKRFQGKPVNISPLIYSIKEKNIAKIINDEKSFLKLNRQEIKEANP